LAFFKALRETKGKETEEDKIKISGPPQQQQEHTANIQSPSESSVVYARGGVGLRKEWLSNERC
jgi:hypothetical protein